jgi:uncharacterized protein
VNKVSFAIGIGFGFLLAATRLNDYDVIHSALTLQEFDVFLLMFSAIAVAMPTLWLLEKTRWDTPLGGPLHPNRVRVERKHLFGAGLFGSGWAIAGTCPGPALAMTAGGGVLGIVVMAGLVSGMYLRDLVDARVARPATVMPDGQPQRVHAGE